MIDSRAAMLVGGAEKEGTTCKHLEAEHWVTRLSAAEVPHCTLESSAVGFVVVVSFCFY